MRQDERRRWEILLDAAREIDGTYAPTMEGALVGPLIAFEACGEADLPGFAVGRVSQGAAGRHRRVRGRHRC